MQAFPHHYTVTAEATPEGIVDLESTGLEELPTAPPAEFDGPGDQWSPETMLIGAVADCFVFSFRAVAGRNKLPWKKLKTRAEGKLDRIEGTTYFTEVTVHAELTIANDVDEARALRLLERAERACLVSNSLKAQTHLVPTIVRG